MTVAKLDELTDGSAKIFGMENFGNTCYCNSILQCLYYIKPFREQVLGFPEGVRPNQKRRTAVPGKTPHPFTVDPSGAKISTSISQQEMNVVNSAVTGGGASSSAHSPVAGADSAAPKSKVSRRMSLFKTKTRDIPETKDAQSGTIDDDGVSSSLGANTGNSAAASSTLPASATADRKTPLPVGLQGIQTGIKLPGQNMSVVGFNEDVFSTSDQKKRAALVRGPILNIDLSFADEYKMPESLFTALKDIFESMAQCSSRVGVVSPNNLINVLKKENELFRSSMHQDAHEFLNFLLNEVIESVDRQSGNNPKWVHDLFEGQLTSETRCLTCENVSRRDEKFLDLSIDLDRNSSVTSCLRQFSASETLCERNKFHCDKCGGLQEAQKRMKVKRLPKILALHLKRFKFTEDMQRNVKLFHKVLYPKHLRLFNTTYDAPNPDKLYELTSVVVHIGGGPYHGHYVSVVKTEHAGWLLFDDEMVESVDDDYVFNFFGNNKGMASAYVLFYQEVPESDVALMPNSEYSASSATEFTVNTVEDDLSSDAESATELNSQTPSLHIQANTTATAATSTTVGSAGSPPTVAVPAYADSITPPKVRNGASSKDKKRGLSFSFKMK